MSDSRSKGLGILERMECSISGSSGSISRSWVFREIMILIECLSALTATLNGIDGERTNYGEEID